MFLLGSCVKAVLLCASLQFLHSLAKPDGEVKTGRTANAEANISMKNASGLDSETTSNESVEELCSSWMDDPEYARRSAWIKREIGHESRRRICMDLNYHVTNSCVFASASAPEKYSYLSDGFLNCSHIYLEPECYELLPNDSVNVSIYKKVLDRPDYLISDDFLLYICADFYENRIFFPFEDGMVFHEDVTRILSMAGAAISSVCLILHIAICCITKAPGNLPDRCLLSLCIALLCAYCSSFLQRAATTSSCLAVGMLMVYFFLASFFWMNVFSYDVWRSMRLATTKLRLTRKGPATARFACYSAYAWGMPSVILVLSIVVHFSTSDVKYRLVFDEEICWFKHRQALSLYFAGPLFALLGINIVLAACSFAIISRASNKVESGDNRSSSDSFDLRAGFVLSIRLCSSMGLMWIFGIIAIITKQGWLWYLFTICSALQGVFIFFSFTVSERSRKAFWRSLDWRKCKTRETGLNMRG